MASRNKKGKIHGIFKSEFQISFFHKPTMEETDVYYYIVIEDLIFIKMRLLFDMVIVIDEIYPLTMSYVESYYDRLFTLLRDQTSVTVVVSLIGNTIPFRQTCIKYDTPIVERDEFLDCSSQFYNKFKNYCGNDPCRYGFYLIALREDTFSAMEKATTESVEEPTKQESTIVQVEPTTTTESDSQDEPSKPLWVMQFESYVAKNEITFVDTSGPDEQGWYRFEFGSHIVKMSVQNDDTCAVIPTSIPILYKMDIVKLLTNFSNRCHINIFIIVPLHDVLYDVLEDSDEWENTSNQTWGFSTQKWFKFFHKSK